MTERGNRENVEIAGRRHAAYADLPPANTIAQYLREVLALSHAFEAQLGQALGCNPTDLAAMQRLIDDGPMTPSELARALDVSTAAATMVVDRLVKLGHVTRREHESDRRKVMVVPAESSIEAAVGELLPIIRGVDQLVAHLSDDQRAAVEDFLASVVRVYGAALRPGPMAARYGERGDDEHPYAGRPAMPTG